MCGYIVVFDQFALDFTVRIPFARLVRSQIGKDKLRSLFSVIFSIVFRYFSGAVRGFVAALSTH
jgi:hypothetical protein